MNRDELLNEPLVKIFKTNTIAFSNFNFYDFALSDEEINFLSAEPEYFISADFYLNKETTEIKHPKWWEFWKKSELVLIEGFEWQKRILQINKSEHDLITRYDELTSIGWTILKSMGNCGTFNIRNVQIENINQPTQYIKTGN